MNKTQDNNYNFKRVAIKIGSNILTGEKGTLNTGKIRNLVSQIAGLKEKGMEVILISSGAVAAGKKFTHHKLKKSDIVSIRQVASSVGQVKLMNTYSSLFDKHGLLCAQVLLTKDDFRDRKHYINIKNCLEKLLAAEVVPVINENDVISVTELMFTDNDELAGSVASVLNCDALFILSNIDGIYNGPPDDPQSAIIPVIDLRHPFSIQKYISAERSDFGRGGMITKYNIAQDIAKDGITVFITNGNTKDVVMKLITQKDSIPHTKFLPVAAEKKSDKKKWLSVAKEFHTAEVYINNGAKKALFSNKATSLLMVGVNNIKGTFKKDDIIKIVDANKNFIGVGKAEYDSQTALCHMGEQKYKPLIHYDYLYIH